jgi:hypothetical protein
VLTSIVGVNTAAIPSFIRAVIGKTVDPDLSAVAAAAPSTVTVDVLNGTSTYLLATRNADQLHKLGFHTDTIDSTPSPVTATSIEYPAGAEAAAKAALAAVPGAKLIETSTVTKVTLELGTDGKQVKGLATIPAPATSTSQTSPSKDSSGGASTLAKPKTAPAGGLGCID